MDIIQIGINVMTTFISLILFFLLRSYWPKYFETKGSNQATKEDIGEITEIVENIKAGVAQHNELMKAQLSFNSQHRLNLKFSERDAIFDFNKKLSAWLYSLLRFTFSGYTIENYKDLKSYSTEFSKRQYEFDLAEAHLLLFLHDKEFVELKRDLSLRILELEKIVIKSINDVYYSYSKCELEMRFDKDDLKRQSEHMGLLYKDLDKLTQDHRQYSTSAFKDVHDLNVKMRQLINIRIKRIEDEERNIS